MYAAAHQNDDVAQLVSGAEPKMAHRVDDLLLPVVKGVGSERAYEILTESLQTFGGSGFLQDYPIEQYIRDAKIDSLYEGTTALSDFGVKTCAQRWKSRRNRWSIPDANPVDEHLHGIGAPARVAAAGPGDREVQDRIDLVAGVVERPVRASSSQAR